jgi:glycosyltransferase involved in cell wall biosynthesis
MPVPIRKKIKSIITSGRWPRVKPQDSHIKAQPLDHHVIERFRAIGDADVPDADVVIATWWETAEWVNALSYEKGAKVHFVQHHEVFEYLPGHRARAVYRLPMHRIVISRWLADVMAQEYGDVNTDLVLNGVDHGQFFAPARGKQAKPTIGFLYHEVSFKGLDVVLDVVRRVHDVFPDLRVICFGSEQPSGRYQCDRFVEFQHAPAQDRIRDLYSQCDLWLTASRTEGFNLPAMEAMACRTPVVSTRAGWPMEAIESGRNGVLCDVDDVDGLAQAVEWVLGLDEKVWRGLSDGAYETVRDASWEQSVQLFERALCRACERARRGEIAGKCNGNALGMG